MSNKEIYRKLCEEHTDLPLFLHNWWLDAVCAEWGVAIVRNGDNIAGVWPYVIEHKLGVSLFRNPALTPYLGPHIFFPHDLKESKRINFEYEVTVGLLKEISPAKVWAVSLLPGQKQVGLYKASGFAIQPKQTFIMPLQDDEQNIFLKLHEDYRRNIRKADAEITIAHEPGMLQTLWEYQGATLNRKDVKMHFSRQQMQQLFDSCIAHNATALWVARKAREVHAILWHVWDNERAYYLVGSKNPTTKDNRAVTALLWHAIKESKKMGKKAFDFEGSMDPGVEQFFRNFGGTKELYMVISRNDSLLWKMKTMIR